MFSVVIPLYNKELSIKNTLQSVLNQTFCDFEIIIVNDGSTDDSVKVVQRFSDERIRLIHQKNQGVSAARNRGIKEAKYDWICFLDGDDLWLPNHLEEVSDMMRIFPDKKVYASSFKYSNGRKMIGDSNRGKAYVINNFFSEYLRTKNLMWTSCVIVNRECINKVGFFDENIAIGEDMDLWSRLSKSFTIVKSNKITAIYRNEAENRSDAGLYKMKKSFLSKLNFSRMDSLEEKQFYASWVWHKTKDFIVKKDLKNVSYLMLKHAYSLIKYK